MCGRVRVVRDWRRSQRSTVNHCAATYRSQLSPSARTISTSSRPVAFEPVQGAGRLTRSRPALPGRLVRLLRRRLGGPVRLADQHRPAGASARASARSCRQPAADPGRADARHHVVRVGSAGTGRRRRRGRTDPVGHTQLGGAGCAAARNTSLTSTPSPAVPYRSAQRAEHLALAAGQVELPLAGPQPAHVAEQHQLLLGERVEDGVPGLRDLVLAQRVHGADVTATVNGFPYTRTVIMVYATSLGRSRLPAASGVIIGIPVLVIR